jgi:hypothetical protein
MKAATFSALIVAAAVLGLCSAIAPAAAASEAPEEMEILGGWNPIKDVSDPRIHELGGWAVSEHVKRDNYGVRFVKVVSGEEQVVSGMNYKLVIAATDAARKSATYGAAAVVRAGELIWAGGARRQWAGLHGFRLGL